MSQTVELKSATVRRLAGLICVVALLPLGGCGLTAKSYSMFDNYQASDQQNIVASARSDQEEASISKSLASQGRAAEFSAQSLLPAQRTAAPTIVAAQPAQTPTDVPTGVYSPMALADMRNQVSQQAADLLKQTDAKPCDPFVAADPSHPVANDTCAVPPTR